MDKWTVDRHEEESDVSDGFLETLQGGLHQSEEMAIISHSDMGCFSINVPHSFPASAMMEGESDGMPVLYRL